jgi:hypothetical protein
VQVQTFELLVALCVFKSMNIEDAGVEPKKFYPRFPIGFHGFQAGPSSVTGDFLYTSSYHINSKQ